MRLGGKAVGAFVIVLTVILSVVAWQHTMLLREQRATTIDALGNIPGSAECNYDTSTCPQAEEIVLPSVTSVGLLLLGILLGLYLIQSDYTNRTILDELRSKRSRISNDEKRELILSILTKDERNVVENVIKQPGISQATLRLRTDFSKAKLSGVLKELELRGLISRATKGKTNVVHVKRDL